ncbi:MAG: hypothetical protein ACM3PW_04260, partial [Chlamydiota bacterium]
RVQERATTVSPPRQCRRKATTQRLTSVKKNGAEASYLHPRRVYENTFLCEKGGAYAPPVPY